MTSESPVLLREKDTMRATVNVLEFRLKIITYRCAHELAMLAILQDIQRPGLAIPVPFFIPLYALGLICEKCAMVAAF